MNLDNYVCENQMSLTDIYPITCCGVEPWLNYTKCFMDGRTDIPQRYCMNYECPKCGKRACDNTGWIIYSYGEFEEAKAAALKEWNNPLRLTTSLRKPGEKIYIPWSRREEFNQKYKGELE